MSPSHPPTATDEIYPIGLTSYGLQRQSLLNESNDDTLLTLVENRLRTGHTINAPEKVTHHQYPIGACEETKSNTDHGNPPEQPLYMPPEKATQEH